MLSLVTGKNPTAIILPDLPAIFSTSESTRTGAVTSLREQHQPMAQSMPLPRPFGYHNQAENMSRRPIMMLNSPKTAGTPRTNSLARSLESKSSPLAAAAQPRQEPVNMGNATQSDPPSNFQALSTTMSHATMAQKRICSGDLLYSHGTRHCNRKGCGFSVTNVPDQCYYSFTTKDGAKIGLDYAPIWASHTVGDSYRFRCRICLTEELFEWLGLFAHLREIHTVSELRGAFRIAVSACYCPDKHSCQKNCAARRHAKAQREWERSLSLSCCLVC
jgi:hypothetical protein